MKAPRVTDHSLVRYLERVRGFDFKRERAAIQQVCQGLGDVVYATVKKDGCLYEIRNGAVVTITPDSGRPCATTRRRVTGGDAR